MRVGSLELLLLDERLNPLEEVEIAGNSYAIGAINQEYSVQVRVHRNKQGEFPSRHFRVGLSIDGNTLPYWKRVDLSDRDPEETERYVTATFVGFKKNASDLRCFQMARPSRIGSHDDAESSSKEETEAPPALGTVKAALHLCKAYRENFKNEARFYEVPTGHVHTKVIVSPDSDVIDPKNASLVTRAGRAFDKLYDPFGPLQRWKNETDEPTEQAVMYYHARPVVLGLQAQESTCTVSATKRKAKTKKVAPTTGKRKARSGAAYQHHNRVVVDSSDSESSAAGTSGTKRRVAKPRTSAAARKKVTADVPLDDGAVLVDSSSSSSSESESDSDSDADDGEQLDKRGKKRAASAKAAAAPSAPAQKRPRRKVSS